MEKGVSVSTVLYTYTPGGSILNHHFIWRLPDDYSVDAAVSKNQQVVSKLQESLPIYHTRAMKQEFVNQFGLLMTNTKPYMLRSIYQHLTNNASSSRTSSEEQVDKRVREALDAEDMDVLIDLRETNEGRVSQYDVFGLNVQSIFLRVVPSQSVVMGIFVLWQRLYLSAI